MTRYVQKVLFYVGVCVLSVDRPMRSNLSIENEYSRLSLVLLFFDWHPSYGKLLH